MTGEEMERAIDFLLKSQANLEQRIEETNRIVGALAQTQNEFMLTVTRAFEAQAEYNRRTDERINALIGIVERLSERGGGEA